MDEISEKPTPNVFKAFGWLGFPLYIKIEERLMRAGHSGIDTPVTVTVLRWHRKRLKSVLSTRRSAENSLAIYILRPWDADKICEIPIPNELPKLYTDDAHSLDDIETCVFDVVTGVKEKTGIVLYGPPGTGKSFYIRYLALKYRLPVYVVAFSADMDNSDIIKMFTHVKGPAIVLFEDFDNYFDNRVCLIANAKMTFDVLLNVFDGIYALKNRIIYAITANDIDKIDPAIKYRPSRFRFVRELSLPNCNVRRKILKDVCNGKFDLDDLVEFTEGFNLDQVFLVKDMILDGYGLDYVSSMINVINVTAKKEQERLAKLSTPKEGENPVVVRP
jgi:SpoVK/Ycf46/Vps4 family AAA+-type ATPase